MKIILVFILLSIFSFIGCSQKSSSDQSIASENRTDIKTHRSHLLQRYPIYKDQYNGVQLVLKQTEYSIAECDTFKYDILNLENYLVMAGYRFEIEFWDGNNWENIPINISVLDIALRIEKGHHLSFSFDLKDVADYSLKTGKYRIITSVDIAEDKKQHSRGNEEIINLYAEFLLVE